MVVTLGQQYNVGETHHCAVHLVCSRRQIAGSWRWFVFSTKNCALDVRTILEIELIQYIRYFQHVHFIPIVGVGKRGQAQRDITVPIFGQLNVDRPSSRGDVECTR